MAAQKNKKQNKYANGKKQLSTNDNSATKGDNGTTTGGWLEYRSG